VSEQDRLDPVQYPSQRIKRYRARFSCFITNQQLKRSLEAHSETLIDHPHARATP
jgi:hypothetical protein